MTHQTTDASISIGERMNVVKPMVSSSHRNDSTGSSEPGKLVTLREVIHELGDTDARWWLVSPNSYVMPRS